VKTTLLVLLFIGIGGEARADWTLLKAGDGPEAVRAAIGPPLFSYHTKGNSLSMWVYDHGGNVLFELGRVKFWTASKVVPGCASCQSDDENLKRQREEAAKPPAKKPLLPAKR
jgi:hypothetical protein